MRLIDADALKQRVIENRDPDWSVVIEPNYKDIVNAPTIDAVIVVRCKDCDYTDESLDEDHDYWCLHHGIYIDADDYCSRGERRTE